MLTRNAKRRWSLSAVKIIKTYECDVCQKHTQRITTLSLASAAMRDLAGCKEWEHFKCKRCQRSFSQKPSLHVHRRKHSKSKPYICTQCNKRFITRSGLELHRNASHQVCASKKKIEKQNTDDTRLNNVDEFPASACLKQLIQMAISQQDASSIKKELSVPKIPAPKIPELKVPSSHSKTKDSNSPKSKRSYSLLNATSMLPIKGSLVLASAPEDPQVTTKKQGVTFTVADHSTSSSDIINYLVNIDMDGKSKPVLVTSGNIGKESSIIGSSGLPCDVKSGSTSLAFDCVDCSESFDSFKLLTNHRKLHVRKWPIRAVCPWRHCGKKLTSLKRLDSHMKRHNGETNYLCDRCGKHFTDCVFYHRHKIVCLQRFRTYDCNICGKVLSGYSALQNHIRTHKGEKPNQCEICGVRFNNISHLTRHKRIHIRKGEMSAPGADSKTSAITMQSVSDMQNDVLLEDYTNYTTPVQIGNEEVVAYCMEEQKKRVAFEQQAEVLRATANVCKEMQ
ncbi:zinc finger protein 569-like [Gigantopelta aegis]|uniref:zinc finger protein 569-like n=1 Tax=Gigantopelta aegis TaxID=1735272 RepID=UPI001B88BBE4|nr:zinc finger protein 569-like [Gigantopelta aegis]